MWRLRLLALFAAGASSAWGQTAPPFSVEDAVSMKRFATYAPIQLSPDGELVAYSVIDRLTRVLSRDTRASRTDRGVPQIRNGSELWVANVGSGAMQRIAGGRGRGAAWAGSWSPDGKSLAYLSDESGQVMVWLWSRISGKTRRIPGTIVGSGQLFDMPRWTPDGRSVVVKLAREVAGTPTDREAKAADSGPRIERFVFRPDSSVTRLDTRQRAREVASWYMSDLGTVDVASGAVRRLVQDQSIMAYWVSPRGDALAYTRMRDDVHAGTNIFDLVVVSLRDGSSRAVARGFAHSWGASASWAPDGQRLALIAMNARSDETSAALPAGCYVVLATGDSLRRIGLGRDARIGDTDVPLWDRAGEHIYVVADDTVRRMAVAGGAESALAAPLGRAVIGLVARAQEGGLWFSDRGMTLLAVVRDTGNFRQGIARIPLGASGASMLIDEDQMFVAGVMRSTDPFRVDAVGERFVAVREGAAEPQDLWMYRGDSSRPQRVTRINPRLARYRFGTGRLVRWISDDGRELRGAVIMPPDYDPATRYPLVVYVYGGAALSGTRNSFGGPLPTVHDVQLLATRGYAVFMPDAPQQFGTPLIDLAKAVLPGVSRLVEMGIADESRLGVVGHSYGGYSVYALITHTTRFRAAVVSAGASNLVTKYGVMQGSAGGEEYAETGQGKIGGSLWEVRDRFIENSPLFHFDRVRTPVLIVHGARDQAVPVWSADEAFVALRRLGREVEYLRYLDEGHSEWSGQAMTDMLTRTLEFLDSRIGRPLATDSRASDGGARP